MWVRCYAWMCRLAAIGSASRSWLNTISIVAVVPLKKTTPSQGETAFCVTASSSNLHVRWPGEYTSCKRVFHSTNAYKTVETRWPVNLQEVDCFQKLIGPMIASWPQGPQQQFKYALLAHARLGSRCLISVARCNCFKILHIPGLLYKLCSTFIT